MQEKDIRLQSSLGDMERFKRRDLNMGGLLSVGKIIGVHHKYHTVDIQLVRNKDVLVGTKSKGGIDACQVVENRAGYDERYQVYYGDLTPYQVGQYVLVAFAENFKDRPFIIGTIHYTEELKNPFPTEPVYESDEAHMYESLKISRLQDYWYFSGKSEFEGVHHSHAFIASREQTIDDSRTGFDFEDLYVKNKVTQKTLDLPESKRQSYPLDFLLNLPESSSSDAGFLRLWLSARTGAFRVTKDKNDNKISFLEITESGGIRAKRQLDTNVIDSSSQYTEVGIGDTGEIKITQCTGGTPSVISISPSGQIQVSTEQAINIHGSKSVSVASDRLVTITAPNVVISG